MDTQAPLHQQQIQSPKITIKILQQSFGKPSKKRQQEPSMFELLKWQNNCLTKHDFKKNRDFKEITEAYLDQIQKSQWTSQAKQNYVIPNGNIQVDQSTYYKVENYLHKKQCQNHKKIPENNIKLNNLQSQNLNINSITNQKNKNKNEALNFHVNVRSSANLTKQNSPNVLSRNNSPNSNQNINKNQIQRNQRLTSPQTSYANNKAPHSKKNAFGYQQNENFQFNQDQQMKHKKQLIQKFKQTTRWIPNSAFTTYFGKPPFQNYGSGNTKPTKGGLVYGTYLYSHNVHPHRGMNTPKSLQSYPVALNKAKSHGVLVPCPPKTKNPDFNNLNSSGDKQTRKFNGINIYPQPNQIGSLQIEKPSLIDIEKFGGNGIEKTIIHKTLSNAENSNTASSNKKTQKLKYKELISRQKENTKDMSNYQQWISLKEQKEKGFSGKKRASSVKNDNMNGKKVEYTK